MTQSGKELGRGERIRLAIEESGKSFASVARRVGVARQTLWRWMDENVDPGNDRLRIIANETGRSMLWLRYGDNVPGVPNQRVMESSANSSHPYDAGVKYGVRWAVSQMRAAIDQISKEGEKGDRRPVELPLHELFPREEVKDPKKRNRGKKKEGKPTG